jgi:hypothetical protein
MIVPNELACYVINSDGSDGCRVGFASRESTVGPNGERFNGALVHLVAVYTPDHEISTVCRLYHHNSEYAVAEVPYNPHYKN